ncbi:hypothetical protein DICPUDRAFT_149623 [Dictyostelium purpureum]|uniref:Uncharacterized protein n=1 Tax=Dictyostelium purpureum TaxID=5786 RepID=F0ZE86_DICPU|nr:uncharacterized protein DICPUDRAFT_149623 [Dictyostelium purpureum]EGC37731.1 hypothetical protein DICPUDRAFT_149623 [Dictyostelium purpureum]|eukprot:XP_003285752.1 hypothetical protein DICPUDRAFT_149623 [Dictyostelium purpureum]
MNNNNVNNNNSNSSSDIINCILDGDEIRFPPSHPLSKFNYSPNIVSILKEIKKIRNDLVELENKLEVLLKMKRDNEINYNRKLIQFQQELTIINNCNSENNSIIDHQHHHHHNIFNNFEYQLNKVTHDFNNNEKKFILEELYLRYDIDSMNERITQLQEIFEKHINQQRNVPQLNYSNNSVNNNNNNNSSSNNTNCSKYHHNHNYNNKNNTGNDNSIINMF